MFLQTSHLALIDTLMMAYTVEMMSVERVMSCVNRHCSAGPSHIDQQVLEQPYDTEDAITTWLNKVRSADPIPPLVTFNVCSTIMEEAFSFTFNYIRELM